MVDRIPIAPLIGEITSEVYAWPEGERRVQVALANDAFTTGRARLTVRLSDDGGRTWFAEQTGEWGATERSTSRGMQVNDERIRWEPGTQMIAPGRESSSTDPHTRRLVTRIATHYQFTLEAVRGIPVVGVK